MIRVLLPLAGPLAVDAADALAVAITHAHHQKTSYNQYESRA
jgi:crossover junction endodeoxyribonuclease RuvC